MDIRSKNQTHRIKVGRLLANDIKCIERRIVWPIIISISCYKEKALMVELKDRTASPKENKSDRKHTIVYI